MFPNNQVRAEQEAGACATALTAEGTRMDAGRLDACATALASLACDAAIPDACAAAEGSLIDDTPCVSGLQCASGHCARDDRDACGRCAPRVTEGGACEVSTMALGGGCAYGLQCTWTFGADAYEVARVPRCGPIPGIEGESCGDERPCAAGLFCRRAPPTSDERTCAPALPEGAACSPAAAETGEPGCIGGTACVGGACTTSKAGEACMGAGGPSFLIDNCEGALACDSESKTCKEIALGQAGDACDDIALRCERGFCSFDGSSTVGKCVRYRAVGESCNANNLLSQCEGISRCVSGTCEIDDASACR
jgi:hypothetical protein